MPSAEFEKRKEEVKALYKSVLQREADVGGLDHYTNSTLTLDEIKKTLKSSLEYTQLHKKENLNRDVASVGNKELLVMGSTPDRPEHLEMLDKAGIGYVLCLDEKVTYPTDWCGSFLHVPLAVDKPIPKESITKCMDFLHSGMVAADKKIFIHSGKGIERAPMVLSLYLVASQNLSLGKAISVVASKRKEINPRKSLVTSSLLQHVYDYRDKFSDSSYKPAPVVASKAMSGNSLDHTVVVVSPRLYLGTSVDNGQLEELKAKGVKTILDLNEKSLKISSSVGSWFAHMKIPAKDSQLNRIMPIIIKTARKYMAKNPVYIVCSNPAVLFMFSDTYAANMLEDDVVGKMNLEAIRKALLS